MANENDSKITESEKTTGDVVSNSCDITKKEVSFDENYNDPPSRKKSRKRKKGLFKPIVEQMEFYLGDANCSRSKFMKAEMEKSPWIDLDIFLTFNKISWMLRETFGHSDNTDDLWTALKAIPSDIFEIRDDSKRQIKRKKPLLLIDERGNDLRTIYIERIPPNVDHDILKHVFEKYGKVKYISLPKFKHNGTPKGFAFLEFESEEGINAALKGTSIESDSSNFKVAHPSANHRLYKFYKKDRQDQIFKALKVTCLCLSSL